MNEIKVYPIGKFIAENDELKIVLEPAYRASLKGLSGYSHVQILWWMDKCDNSKDRTTLIEKKPYTKGPEEIGVFCAPFARAAAMRLGSVGGRYAGRALTHNLLASCQILCYKNLSVWNRYLTDN